MEVLRVEVWLAILAALIVTALMLWFLDRYTFTVEGKKIEQNALLWSKTILITGSVGKPGVDQPHRKINAFFVRSMALSVPIYRHFQSNGDNW